MIGTYDEWNITWRSDVCHFWETIFPSFGEKITRWIAPYLNPRSQHAVSMLADLARYAVFWKTDVQTCIISDWNEARKAVCVPLGRELRVFQTSEFLRMCVRSFFLKFGLGIDAGLEAFYAVLACGVGDLLAGKQPNRFRLLIELWRYGNFPLGFDRTGKLVVYCVTLR